MIIRSSLEHLLDLGEETIEKLPARNGPQRIVGPIALDLLVDLFSCQCPSDPGWKVPS